LEGDLRNDPLSPMAVDSQLLRHDGAHAVLSASG